MRKNILVLTCFIFGLTSFQLFPVSAQIYIDTLDGRTAADRIIDGKTVLISHVNFRGSPLALGYFRDTTSMLGFEEGIVLSTGNIFFMQGPNKSEYTSYVNQQYGDKDLEELTRGRTYDAAVLEFDFIPAAEYVEFEYVFASEEYTEYVGSKFNDVFGFWIGPTDSEVRINVGTLPDHKTPVTINTVNNEENSEYYIDNDYFNTTDPILWDTRKRKVINNRNFGKPPREADYFIQFDGFTTVLTARLNVVPGKSYRIKMAISDVSDAIYDSWVIIQGRSFRSTGENRVELERFVQRDLEPVEGLGLTGTTLPSTAGLLRKVTIPEFSPELSCIVNFPFDKYDLTSAEGLKLQDFRSKLGERPDYFIQIVGHTDNFGSDEYNIRLSSLRARSVATRLEYLGIPANRIVLDHYGEFRPVETNETPQGRARNRRVEVLLYRSF